MSFSKFPEFQKLTIADKDSYLQYYARLDEPYSDFSLDNVFMWLDFHNNLEVCDLNNNLILRFTDILENDRRSYSLVGNSNIEKTVDTLLNFLIQHEKHPKIYYVPEQVVNIINQLGRFDIRIEEDVDNKDYVYRVDDLAEMHGKRYRNLRERVIKFKNNENIDIRPLNCRDSNDKNVILSMIEKWSTEESLLHNDPKKHELAAIKKHLALAVSLNILAYGIYINDKLVCIIITHFPPHKGWLIGNHLKYDYNYAGIFGYAVHELSLLAKSQGITWLNIEQDLGLEGLRNIKTLLRPEKFLRRYTVSLDSEAKYQ